MEQYYVYGIFVNSVIIYVGKGYGNRKDHHLRNFLLHNTAVNKILRAKLQKAVKNNDNINVEVLIDRLSQDQALTEEAVLIRKYGRKINGTGTLCNVTEGGNQPPSRTVLRKLLNDTDYNSIQQKQCQTQKKNYAKKIQEKIPTIQRMLDNGELLYNIAKEIGVGTATLRTYIRKSGLKVNYEGKQKKIKEHLEKYRSINRQKPNKNAKLYTIKEPSGNITKTRLLKQYCKTHAIDYSNLRATFKRGGSCKGYSIIDQQEPETL